jgi:hypothetical protein
MWVQLMTVSYQTTFYSILFVKSFYSYDMHVLFEEHKNKALQNGKHITSITVIVYKNRSKYISHNVTLIIIVVIVVIIIIIIIIK